MAENQNQPTAHQRANLRVREIRDLKTGEILTRVGHTAEEILRSREPIRHKRTGEIVDENGPRRFVLVGSEPAGWHEKFEAKQKRAAPVPAEVEPEPEPEPEDEIEDEDLPLAEDEPDAGFVMPDDDEEIQQEVTNGNATKEKPKGQGRKEKAARSAKA